MTENVEMNIELVSSGSENAETFMVWRGQEAMLRHNPLAPVSLEKLRDIMSKEGSDLTKFEEYDSFRWLVRIEDEFVGNVSIQNINRTMNLVDIGYAFDEKYHGRGFATQAVRMVLENVFSQTPVRKVLAFVHDENIPSCRLLERLGFQKEGFLREHFIINGKPVNEVFYGLLKQDFYCLK